MTTAAIRFAFFALLLAGSTAGSAADSSPKIVASIQPVHSLVAGVMEGIGNPVLLVRPGVSPHGYQLRPSEAEALSGADVVVWVGEALETFLTRPIESLGRSARVVELMKAPGVELLPVRGGGVWEAHTHENDHEDHASEHEHDHDAHHADEAHGHGHGNRDERYDAHIWLNPANAEAITRVVASALAEADPAHKEQYAANADALAKRLTALRSEIEVALAPVRDRPFIVLHDAYHYLEHAFGLRAAGSIMVSPERPPSAARMAELRGKVRSEGAVCVFSEPQAPTRLVDTLVEGTRAGTGVLDAEGSSGIEPGPDAYFTLMRRNAKALADCLARAS